MSSPTSLERPSVSTIEPEPTARTLEPAPTTVSQSLNELGYEPLKIKHKIKKAKRLPSPRESKEARGGEDTEAHHEAKERYKRQEQQQEDDIEDLLDTQNTDIMAIRSRKFRTGNHETL